MAIKLNYPVNGPITQLFGENPQFYKRWGYAGHNGIDWGIPVGTPIKATADGNVDKVDFENGGYGNFVRMSHKDGNKKYYTYYAHLHSTAVKAGQKITAGTVVGFSGNTGASTGPHLHFGVKIDGQNPDYKGYLDPMPFLTGTAPSSPASPSTPETGSDPQAPVVPGAIVGAIDLPKLDFVVTYDGVNVRSGPGIEFTILEQLSAGTKGIHAGACGLLGEGISFHGSAPWSRGASGKRRQAMDLTT